jgi:hypothetical protein
MIYPLPNSRAIVPSSSDETVVGADASSPPPGAHAPPMSLAEEVIAIVNSMGIEFNVNPTFDEVVTRLRNYLASHPRSAAMYKKAFRDYIKDCVDKGRLIRSSDSLEQWINERHDIWVQYQAAVKAALESEGSIPMPERPPRAYCCNTLWCQSSMINTMIKIAFRVDLCEENPGKIFFDHY